jgi:hypothetical protein
MARLSRARWHLLRSFGTNRDEARRPRVKALEKS